MPLWIEAGFWGLFAGSALLIGAALGYFVSLPVRLIAAVMAIGAGVLISAVAFELMDAAYRLGGFHATALGFLAGGAAYTAANVAISRRGAKHRKRSGSDPHERQPHAGESSGLAIAVGSLMDGIPESAVIGVSLHTGGGVSAATVAAVFLSNVPESLSSSAGMRRAGRSTAYVFGVWSGIVLASGVAALIGNVALSGADVNLIAATNAVAAGAILAMLADTMIPEAYEQTHEYSGLITVVGFLAAFIVTKGGG